MGCDDAYTCIHNVRKRQDGVPISYLILISTPGDHDAIGILLMIPRIISKCELLSSQLKEKVLLLMLHPLLQLLLLCMD